MTFSVNLYNTTRFSSIPNDSFGTGPASCGTTGSRPSFILYFLSAPFTLLSVHSRFLYRPIYFAVELVFWNQSFISLDFSTLAIQTLLVLILKKLFLELQVWRRSCWLNSRQQWLLQTSNNSDSAELGGRINFYNEFKNVMTVDRAIWNSWKGMFVQGNNNLENPWSSETEGHSTCWCVSPLNDSVC